jgi:uncharacterized Zn-finger protein
MDKEQTVSMNILVEFLTECQTKMTAGGKPGIDKLMLITEKRVSCWYCNKAFILKHALSWEEPGFYFFFRCPHCSKDLAGLQKGN